MPGGRDPAFAGAGTALGLRIWRVKDFALVEVDKKEFGTFYSGDSYLLLYCYGDPKRPSADVHIWLGDETTRDEAGTAAIKMVELDDALGGFPIQHREVQGHESPLFLSYFQQGSRRNSFADNDQSTLRYLKGGYESGFRHVGKEKFGNRLYQVKGRRSVKVNQVELSAASLNKSDAFILDRGNSLLVWLPPGCNRRERREAVRQATAIRDEERSGRAELEILDSDWDSNKEFWELMNGTPDSVAAEAGEDEDFLASAQRSLRLFRISDASGRMEKTLVGEGRLELSMLDTNDAFILDAGQSLFVWIGQGCNRQERSKAMDYASEHLEAEGRPSWVPTSRELEGAETGRFRQWFADADIFRPSLFHVSDASGRMCVEEIGGVFGRGDLVKEDAMVLDGGSIVWVWVGSGATEKERSKAEAVARHHLRISVIPRGQNAAVKVVVDGEEPAEFKRLFPSWDDKSVRTLAKEVYTVRL